MTREGARKQRRRAESRRPRTTGAGAGTRLRGRHFVIATGLIAICLMIAGILFTFRHLRPSVPPNVLLITIDTLRADHVGCYRTAAPASGRGLQPSGTVIDTPVLDRLAARGTLFVNAVSQVPLTLPSHASMLTGLTPPAHGVRDNAGFALGAAVPTVAEQFRSAGYATAAFVSGYSLDHRFGLDRGFDVYDDRFPRGDNPGRPFVERRADATIRAASAWLEQVARAPARPFFSWVHLFDPHAPYDPPEPFRSRFHDDPYDGEIAFADSQIGVLLDGLAGAGVLANTVVLAVSDHGEGLGDHDEATHGLLIYDSTIRIPLILAGPGVRSGVRATTLVRAMDVGPTLLDLAGLPAVKGAEGRSLQAGARGRELPPEDAYVEALFGRLNFGWAPIYGWRSRRAMFIEAPRPELYDVEADPAQVHDLSAARAADVATYRQRLRALSSRNAAGRRAPLTAEARERLNSLGYVSGTAAAGAGPLHNPKDFVALAFRIEKAVTSERSDPRMAAEEFRAALNEDPTNTLAREHLAIALSYMRRFDEALREAQPLIAAGNASADLLALVGDCYRVTGRYDRALDVFRDAAARDPQAADPMIGVGRTLVALGRRDEARAAFERALSLAPDAGDALSGLADLALERGDLAEARVRLETLRADGRSDASAELKLGVVLVRQGELDRAIALFREVSESEPGNVNAAVNLGGALAKAGRAAEAVPYFERAIAGGVRSPVVWNSLAAARLESGNQAGAVEALRQSLRTKRDQPDIAAMLQKLQGR